MGTVDAVYTSFYGQVHAESVWTAFNTDDFDELPILHYGHGSRIHVANMNRIVRCNNQTTPARSRVGVQKVFGSRSSVQ